MQVDLQLAILMHDISRDSLPLVAEATTIEQIVEHIPPATLWKTPYESYINWDEVSSSEWASLIIKDVCIINGIHQTTMIKVLDSYDIVRIMTHRSNIDHQVLEVLGDKLHWNRLLPHNWLNLFEYSLKFAQYTSFSVQTGWNGYQIMMAIREYPELLEMGIIPLDEMNGAHWVSLLSFHPDMASKCDWTKLGDSDYESLAFHNHRSPEYIKNRPPFFHRLKRFFTGFY